jgi:hypothetical protein
VKTRRGEPRHTRAFLSVLVVAGLGGVAVSWFVAQHSLVGGHWTFLGYIAAWIPLWVTGAWAAGRLASLRLCLGLVLLFAVLTRLAAASGTSPSVSSDMYRYGWDARVQLAGIDPYRYAPNAPQLRSLRSPPYWPAPQECRHIGKMAGCTTINRPAVRTIYPAGAEAWFDVVALAYPGRSGSRPWQLAGGLVDVAIIGSLIVFLHRSGQDPRRVAWYALSPIPVIEFAGNGHVDSLALLLLVAALLALQRRRPVLAGFLIGLATVVKLYPAVALIAGWRRGGSRMLAAAGVTAMAAELPHLLVVGTRLLGYLPGYLAEEHYASGSRFLLLGILPAPGEVVSVLAVGCMAVAGLWVLRSRLEPAAATTFLLAVLILVTTPVQPWYAVTLAGVGMTVGAEWLILPALVGEIYYAAVIFGDPHQFLIGRACYGLALLGVLACAWWARRRLDEGDPARTYPVPANEVGLSTGLEDRAMSSLGQSPSVA